MGRILETFIEKQRQNPIQSGVITRSIFKTYELDAIGALQMKL